MTSLWGYHGPNTEAAYSVLRDGGELYLRARLDDMWGAYEPYADPEFISAFACDLEARYWEMYVGCKLLATGRTLLTAAHRQGGGGLPDICVVDKSRRIWIEAVAPGVGQPGPNQVIGPVPINQGGGFAAAPVNQALLRMTHALAIKGQAFAEYMDEGTVAADDIRLIAIGVGRFGLYVSDDPIPLILRAVFPIGDEVVTVDLATNQIVQQGFHPSLHIPKHGGCAIEQTAFLGHDFEHVSGIIWSRAGLRTLGNRPTTLVHNPMATSKMIEGWPEWDKEFVASEQGEEWIAADIKAQPAVAADSAS